MFKSDTFIYTQLYDEVIPIVYYTFIVEKNFIKKIYIQVLCWYITGVG